MQHLFGHEGEAALAALMARSPLLAFDFDGTLAPIVARPECARPSLAVSARLATLAERLPLAIVSGRGIGDLRGRLGFEPAFIVGNHGAEIEGLDAPVVDAAELDPLRARLIAAAERLSTAGVTVEDKGPSISLHYRLSRTRERAGHLIAELLAAGERDWRVFGGKLVVNVVPKRAPDKADAVRMLLARCGASSAFFAGDDVNDEPVFRAAPPDWLTVRVGRDDPRSRAMYFLDSPAEIALLLERMVAATARAPAR